jgi:DNA-binding GntR family transcriptional regulator
MVVAIKQRNGDLAEKMIKDEVTRARAEITRLIARDRETLPAK